MIGQAAPRSAALRNSTHLASALALWLFHQGLLEHRLKSSGSQIQPLMSADLDLLGLVEFLLHLVTSMDQPIPSRVAVAPASS